MCVCLCMGEFLCLCVLSACVCMLVCVYLFVYVYCVFIYEVAHNHAIQPCPAIPVIIFYSTRIDPINTKGGS